MVLSGQLAKCKTKIELHLNNLANITNILRGRDCVPSAPVWLGLQLPKGLKFLICITLAFSSLLLHNQQTFLLLHPPWFSSLVPLVHK